MRSTTPHGSKSGSTAVESRAVAKGMPPEDTGAAALGQATGTRAGPGEAETVPSRQAEKNSAFCRPPAIPS
jgi:hypothetical protein